MLLFLQTVYQYALKKKVHNSFSEPYVLLMNKSIKF